MTTSTDTPRALRFKGQIAVSGVLECLSGLHVGGNRDALTLSGVELPVARDPATHMPIIPGSSLKGRLRALLEMLRGRVRFERGQVAGPGDGGRDAIDLLFGSGGSGGRGGPTRLVVRDAVALVQDQGRDSTVALWASLDSDGLGTEIKAEAALNRVTAAAQPRQIERVVAGSRFALEFVVSVFDEHPDEEALVKDLLVALALLEDSYLGGHGSRGYGRVRIGLRENAAIASAQDYESGRRRTAPSGDLKSLSDIDGDRWIAAAVQAFSNATHDRT